MAKPKPRTKPITFQFLTDEEFIARLKRVAKLRYTDMSTYARQTIDRDMRAVEAEHPEKEGG